MKTDIHPKYVDAVVICGCGHSFTTRSTRAEIKVEICSNCHPFYTGQQKYVDTAGRVQKFMERYGNYRKKQPADESTADTAETPAS